jgi:CHAT domain-containing protein
VSIALGLPPLAAAAAAPAAENPAPACEAGLEQARVGDRIELDVAGRNPVETSVPAPAGHEVLVVAREQGNDVTLDVTADGHATGSRADNPVRRSGPRSALVVPATATPLGVRLTGKEHAAVTGRVAVAAYDLTALGRDGRCVRALRALAAADRSYARGQDVSLARLPATTAAARHAYLLAAEGYLLAYTLLDAPADAPLRLDAAQALAAIEYQDLQDWARAADWAARAAQLAGDLDQPYSAARASAVLAAAWIELASRSAQPQRSAATPAPAHALFERARALLVRLERFHRERGERYDAALQLNNAGLADLFQARFVAAKAEFTRAALRFAALRERPRQGLALQNVALAEWGRGDLVAAVHSFHEALEWLGPEPYPKLYLIALTNSALVNVAIGDFDEALRLNAAALAYSRKVAARLVESQSLYGLGITYYALGDHELAQRYLEESLAKRSARGDPRGRVATLRALGTLYSDRSRFDAATAADEEALALSTTPTSRARMLVRLAADKAATGRTDEALQSFAAVLGGPPGMDPGPRIEALIERGRLFRLAGRQADALRDLRSALVLIHRHDSPDTEFRAELELARTLRLNGQLPEAVTAVDRALARGDELRRQTANPEFRALRQEPLRPAFDLKVSLLAERHRQLLQQGKLRAADLAMVAALAAAEAGRAQSLAELSASRLPPAAAGTLRPLLERRERLYRDLGARRYRLVDRENTADAADPTVLALRSDIAATRLELDTLNADIARRTGSREGHERFRPDAVPKWLRQRTADTAIVEYWLGADEAYAWTISRDGIRWTTLGPSAAITDAARTFHGALRDVAGRPARDRQELAAALYRLVIAPVADQLPPGRSLVAIPDGALHFIPLAALRTDATASGRYLVEDRDVAVAPAAWWLMAQRQRRSPGVRPARFLLVADPIYREDDERLGRHRPAASAASATGGGVDLAGDAHFGALRRLPWTAHEAKLVAALLPAAAVDELTGADATRARLLALDWTRYRIIHLASHGIVDAGMPQLSALILGAFDAHGNRVEQALRVVDLAALNLTADIVALSACDTALGKEIAGEGSMGLASTAIARGAGAVLASLWQAPDEMAARLMTEFYRGILVSRTSPAAAFGSAMRTVLAGDRAADPGLWAAFQLSVSRLDDDTGVRL